MSVQELIEDEISEIESSIDDVRADLSCLEDCESLADLKQNLQNLLTSLKTAIDRTKDAISCLN
jgi:ElaB/YqjD/DUF883 family membrane-anchored ribosome-binding protein